MLKEEMEKFILDQWTKEGLANGWVAEHLKYNYIKEQKEELEEKLEKVKKILKNNDHEFEGAIHSALEILGE